MGRGSMSGLFWIKASAGLPEEATQPEGEHGQELCSKSSARCLLGQGKGDSEREQPVELESYGELPFEAPRGL
jgi:hypothetical protein